jgi:L-ribulose-5-phosphate 3-epimerase
MNKKHPVRKSITLRMFPDDMPTLRRVEIARDAGYDGVEINLEPWQEYTLASGEDDLARLHREITARGMCVSAVYSREQWHYPMTSRSPQTRSRCKAVVEGLARCAVVLGAGTVLIMPGGVDNSVLAPQPEIVPYLAAYENSLATLRELARTAGERYEVTLAVENCPAKFLLSPLEFARFIDAIDSPWVKAYFDTGNALPYGFPEDWIDILGARIHAVHFKDLLLRSGSVVCATALLGGDVNWPAVRRALAGIHFDGWVTAEVLTPYRYHSERLIYETSASIDAICG